MKNVIFIIVISLFLISCSKKAHDEVRVVDSHTSKNSLNWAGTYKGVLPCADCEGIETVLILFNDSSYHFKQIYLGKKNNEFEKHGSFVWNKEGNTIELENISDSPNKYLVRENSLVQLDIEGNVIAGELANKYLLNKVQEFTVNRITDVTWRLVEIQGKQISRLSNSKKPIQIRLNSNENRVNGFGGCNNFWGSFNLQEGNRVSFSKMASTLMTCPDLQLETELYRVLDRTDNYAIKDNILSLNKAKMAPLAKFEAVFE